MRGEPERLVVGLFSSLNIRCWPIAVGDDGLLPAISGYWSCSKLHLAPKDFHDSKMLVSERKF